jgi:hypothetical protein
MAYVLPRSVYNILKEALGIKAKYSNYTRSISFNIIQSGFFKYY